LAVYPGRMDAVLQVGLSLLTLTLPTILLVIGLVWWKLKRARQEAEANLRDPEA